MKNYFSGTLSFNSLFVSTLVNIVLSGWVLAQDANYWTYQYGSRSTLLGGAVIGSVLDLSGTYYNPGGLSLIEDPDVLLAAKVFDYPRYSISSPGLENADLTSSRLKPAPSIVATMFKFKWQGSHRLALSVFTRYESKIEFSNVLMLPQNTLGSSLSSNSFISDFKLNEKLNEVWGGLTWSYKVGPKMGIGISQFLTFRNHDSYFKALNQVVTPEGDILLFLNGREFKYDFYGIIWKFGTTFDFQGLTFGLTATTPSLEFYSKGRCGVNITYMGEDLDGDGKQDTWAAAHYQKDTDIDLHTPMSYGIGTTFKIYKTNVYFSAEWFSGVEKYEVIPTVYFRSQIGGDTLRNGVIHELRAVLNVGVGIQHSFNDNVSLNSSFTTDFSAKDPASDTNLAITSWDIYHFLIGTTFKVNKSEFTLGVGFSYAKDHLDLSDWSLNDLRNSLTADNIERIDFIYRNYKFVLGFSI